MIYEKLSTEIYKQIHSFYIHNEINNLLFSLQYI